MGRNCLFCIFCLLLVIDDGAGQVGCYANPLLGPIILNQYSDTTNLALCRQQCWSAGYARNLPWVLVVRKREYGHPDVHHHHHHGGTVRPNLSLADVSCSALAMVGQNANCSVSYAGIQLEAVINFRDGTSPITSTVTDCSYGFMGDNAFGVTSTTIPNAYTPINFVLDNYLFLEYQNSGVAQFLQLYALSAGSFTFQVSLATAAYTLRTL